MIEKNLSLYNRIHDDAIAWAEARFREPGARVMFFLFLLPDLVRLMIKLLEDTRVSLFDKIFILSVLIYVVFPIDVLPEMLAGPFGLIEDALLAGAMLVRLVGNPANAEAIQEHWNGDPAVIRKIRQMNQRVERLLTKWRE